MDTVVLVLAIAAFILAAIAQFQAQGRDLVAWGVMALALVHLIGVLG